LNFDFFSRISQEFLEKNIFEKWTPRSLFLVLTRVNKVRARLIISKLFDTGYKEKACRPEAGRRKAYQFIPSYGRLKSLQICQPTRQPDIRIAICRRPTADAVLWPVKNIENRPSYGTRAGYKACNMLVTYGWRMMVKVNKIGEYSSIFD
jgi:hypothetical protein